MEGSSSEQRGRKLKDSERLKIEAAVRELIQKYRAGKVVSLRDVADRYGVSKSTLHRHFKEATRASSSSTSPSQPSSSRHSSSVSSSMRSSSRKPGKGSIDYILSHPK